VTALAADKIPEPVFWDTHDFTLASGNKAYRGSELVYNPATNKVALATSTSGPGVFAIGSSVDAVDATSADKVCSVKLPRGLWLEWMVNATAGDAVAATDVGKTVFLADDQTVTITALAHTPLGVALAVDSTRGVLVLRFAPGEGRLPLATSPAVGSYTSNDFAPTSIVNGSVNDVPTTGAASTITLPAAAPDGTEATFVADGTKNGHTVTYRDATGPTALTTALTASKRHLCRVCKREGKWFANAYVSP
jgi:hypothetical protein